MGDMGDVRRKRKACKTDFELSNKPVISPESRPKIEYDPPPILSFVNKYTPNLSAVQLQSQLKLCYATQLSASRLHWKPMTSYLPV